MIFKQKEKLLTQKQLNQKNYQSLIFALFCVLLPHFFYLPILLTGLIIIILMLWQILIIKHGNFQIAQSKWLQYIVIISGLTIIYSQFKTFLGIEAGCSVLSLILLGKAFEVKNYRDAIIQLNFSLFVSAAVFLYGQSIFLAISVVIAVAACLYSMYQLQNYYNAYEEVIIQDVSTQQLRQQAYKTVIKLLFLATPLMIVLFLFFPRIPPLWNIPTSNNQAKTGVSDEMSPGDIANLSQSNALAFRVIFNQPQQLPAKSQLYWRAMVLEDFDGIKWTQNYSTKYTSGIRQIQQHNLTVPAWYSVKNTTSTISYKMIIEPTFQPWIYALDYSLATAPIILKPDFSLQLPFALNRRQQFSLELITPQPVTNLEIQDRTTFINSRLPEQKNPKSWQFAQQLFKQYQENPEAYSQAILNWIREQNFSYTLSPPLLNGDRIDDFLFRTRSGFCEHYASAYVNLMRMAGIPARVVVGYQGGKAAPDGASWEVRQLDAHAWAEVWFQNKGWVRIDPTAAIAPDRIENGMQDFSQQNSSILGDQNYSAWQMRWLTQARIWMDYANYQWQNKVVGFDQDRQRDWLKKLSINNLSIQLMLLIIIMSITIALAIWWLSRQQRKTRSKLELLLIKLSNKLSVHQLERLNNEPIMTWLNRVKLQDNENEQLIQIINLYTQHIYIQSLPQQKLDELYKLLSKYTFKSDEI